MWKKTVSLVTGAASGLGKAVAQCSLKNGGYVLACDLPESKGEQIYKDIPNSIFVPCDVSSEEDVKSALEICKNKFGYLDIVVNSASISRAFKISNPVRKNSVDINIINDVFKPDLYGTFNVIRLAAPLMSEKTSSFSTEQNGIIINISSTAGYDGIVTQSIISAAKGAVNSMTLPLAREFAPLKIRVVAIAPGLIDTPILSEYCLTKFTREFLQKCPLLGRFGTPEEFSSFVEDVISNPMLNGEILKFTGGLRQFSPKQNFPEEQYCTRK